jgi:hypothetical protein
MFNCRVCSGTPWDLITSWMGEKPKEQYVVPNVSSAATVIAKPKTRKKYKNREFQERSEEEVKLAVQAWFE